MKKNFLMIVVSLTLVAASNVWALEWGCTEMKKFVNSMYALGDILNTTPEFDESTKFEEGMDKLVTILETIAKDEEMDSFTNAFTEMKTLWMKESWTPAQRDRFRRAFDATSVNLERVYGKYCNE